MELKHTNFTSDIGLTIKFNIVEHFVYKNCENWVQKQILYTIFFKKMQLWLPTKQDAP